MRHSLARAGAVAALLVALSPAARADIAVGDAAPGFTKSELAGGPGAWSKGGPVSLSNPCTIQSRNGTVVVQ